MNLRKIAFRATAGFSLTLLSCCAPKYVYKSIWQDKPVVIDGQTNDWEVPLRFFDEKTRLNYSITNDAQNLYICVRATDNDNVQGITRRGLQLWIDTTGKKGHEMGIMFPVMQKPESGQGGNQGRHGGDASENGGGYSDPQTPTDPDMIDTAKEGRRHRQFIQSATQMKTKGLLNVPDGLIELPNQYGINLAVSWNSYNVLVYEASIPLKIFLKNPVADSAKTFGVSLNFTIIPKKQQSSGGGGHGGGMHGGGMGGSMGGAGGMHGGGGGGGGHSGGSSDPETESTWAAFRLSTSK